VTNTAVHRRPAWERRRLAGKSLILKVQRIAWSGKSATKGYRKGHGEHGNRLRDNNRQLTCFFGKVVESARVRAAIRHKALVAGFGVRRQRLIAAALNLLMLEKRCQIKPGSALQSPQPDVRAPLLQPDR